MSNNRELHKKIYLFHDILYTFSVFCSSDDELQKSYQRSSIPARPDAHRGFPEFFTLFQTPGAGIEPATNRLTGDCSTAELSRNEFSKIHLDFNLISFLLQPFMPLKNWTRISLYGILLINNTLKIIFKLLLFFRKER